MSGGKLRDQRTVLDWASNFTNNKNRFATNTAAISLGELENFIKGAKEKCPGFAGLRIYFVRFPLPAQKEAEVRHKIASEGNNLSQPSLVLVPVKSFDSTNGAGEDFKLGNDVFALAFADPDDPDPGDEAILCPPKCG